MATLPNTRVSSRGQVVLPKAVRDARGWTAATELVVENRADGVLLRAVEREPKAHSLFALASFLPRPKRKLSDAELQQAVVDYRER